MADGPKFDGDTRVGDVVARHPSLSRVFEGAGIDYCCAGRRSLREAADRADSNLDALVAALEGASAVSDGEREVDVLAMSLTELADHIESVHHTYLHAEIPRIEAMAQKVAGVHGGKEPRLMDVRDTFAALVGELEGHMMREERILFPMIRELDSADVAPEFHCGSLANPIGQMGREHDDAGARLEEIHRLCDGYEPPRWACNTFRALFDALATFESDLHSHIHKENNVLFPRAIEMERAKAASAASA